MYLEIIKKDKTTQRIEFDDLLFLHFCINDSQGVWEYPSLIEKRILEAHKDGAESKKFYDNLREANSSQ